MRIRRSRRTVRRRPRDAVCPNGVRRASENLTVRAHSGLRGTARGPRRRSTVDRAQGTEPGRPMMESDQEIAARTEALVADNRGIVADRVAFRTAQFDAGLAMVHFTEGYG